MGTKETPKFFNGDVDAMAALTRVNHHTEAYILGAKILGLPTLVTKLEHVKCLQDLEGHLPKGLSDYRQTLYDGLIEQARAQLSAEDFAAFYGAL